MNQQSVETTNINHPRSLCACAAFVGLTRCSARGRSGLRRGRSCQWSSRRRGSCRPTSSRVGVRGGLRLLVACVCAGWLVGWLVGLAACAGVCLRVCLRVCVVCSFRGLFACVLSWVEILVALWTAQSYCMSVTRVGTSIRRAAVAARHEAARRFAELSEKRHIYIWL